MSRAECTIESTVPAHDYHLGDRLGHDGAVWFVVGIERVESGSRLTLRWAYDK